MNNDIESLHLYLIEVSKMFSSFYEGVNTIKIEGTDINVGSIKNYPVVTIAHPDLSTKIQELYLNNLTFRRHILLLLQSYNLLSSMIDIAKEDGTHSKYELDEFLKCMKVNTASDNPVYTETSNMDAVVVGFPKWFKVMLVGIISVQYMDTLNDRAG